MNAELRREDPGYVVHASTGLNLKHGLVDIVGSTDQVNSLREELGNYGLKFVVQVEDTRLRVRQLEGSDLDGVKNLGLSIEKPRTRAVYGPNDYQQVQGN